MQARLTRTSRYVRVDVSGPVELGPLLRVIKSLASETRRNKDTLALVSLLKTEGSLSFTGQFLLGEHVAQHLSHLHKLASVVPADRITRTSEKVARAQGIQLSVFDADAPAVAWLLADDAPLRLQEARDTSPMDPVRGVFWDAYRYLFPPHAHALQAPNGSLLISWSVNEEPSAVYGMSTPITVRFERELLDQMEAADPAGRERLAAQHEQAFRAGLVGYDPYAAIPQARVIVLG